MDKSKFVETLENVIYLAPSRCGRTFYECLIQQEHLGLSVKFVFTNKYIDSDHRLRNDRLFPDCLKIHEQWHQTGMAIGTLEYFLNENNISYTINDSDIENYVEILINDVDILDLRFDIKKYTQYNHTNRGFDMSPVDDSTVNSIHKIIDDFIVEYPEVYKIFVTDRKTINNLYTLAATTQFAISENFNLKQQQMMAPMILSIPPKHLDNNFKSYLYNTGRLYSKIGLTAVDAGYHTGFNNCFNYEDPRFKRVEDVLHMKYEDIDINNYVMRTFICIGKRYDNSKPFNWHPFNTKIITSRPKLSKEFIKVLA